MMYNKQSAFNIFHGTMGDDFMRCFRRVLLLKLLFGLVLIIFVSAGTVFAGFSQNDIQKMLDRPYEKNADAMMAHMRQGRYEDVETFVDYVIKNKIRTRDGFRYFRALLGHWFFASEVLEFKRTQPVPMDLLPYLDAWIESRPESDIAYIIRGVLRIEHAWEIRKRGYGKTVKKKQWKPFYALHELARADLEKAYAIDPANPHSSRQLIRVQRAENAKDQKATDLYFQRATRQDPSFYWAYRAKLENMMPKWGGKWKNMVSFAIETAQNAPPGTLLPHIYVYAIEETAARSRDEAKLLNQEKIWKRLEGIYRQILIDYPKSSYWRVKFAKLALDAEKESLAGRLLEEAERISRDDYRVSEVKAVMAGNNGDWKTEEKYARRLIQSCPFYYRGYTMLGYSQMKQAHYNDAIESYTLAIELKPKSASYWGKRCYCHNQIGDYGMAIDDCSRAIELNKRYKFGYKQRELAYKAIGDTEAAKMDRRAYKKLK